MSATLAKGINAFKEVIDAPIASFFSSCVHCGLCAEACLFYTETGDPKYTPIHKLEPLRRIWQQEYTLLGKLGKMLGLSKPVTDAELTEWKPLVYDSCTMCWRCAMVCPVGNDMTYMIRKMREGMAASGHAPEGLIGASTRSVEIGSPMGIQPAGGEGADEACAGRHRYRDSHGCGWCGISGADVLDGDHQLPRIPGRDRQDHEAGRQELDVEFGSIRGYQQRHPDRRVRHRARAGQRVVDGAEKLKVKTVISPECGHAFTALRWEGPNLVGHAYTFEVQHILEVLDDFRKAGLLKTTGFEETRLTFHDPCQIVRRGGVLEQPRNLLKLVAKNFVDTKDHGKMNWCCGGGGGVSAIEEAEPLRLQAFKVKKAQLEETGAKTLVTACANCRIVMEEGLEHYHMGIPVVGLTELIADHLTEGE